MFMLSHSDIITKPSVHQMMRITSVLEYQLHCTTNGDDLCSLTYMLV